MQSVDLIETYTYGMSKNLVSEKEKISNSKRIKEQKNH